MDINNKALAVLLIVAIVASLGGIITIMNINDAPTGLASEDTSTGTVDYNISSNVLVNFTTASINFGVGYIDTSTADNCTMDTQNNNNKSSSSCVGLSAVNGGLVLENIGNKNASINLSFTDVNAFLSYISGGQSHLKYRVNDSSEGACNSSTPSVYTTVAAAGVETTICDEMNTITASDSFVIDLEIAIDYRESGNNNMTITAEANEL
jgi:hypothetical protein